MSGTGTRREALMSGTGTREETLVSGTGTRGETLVSRLETKDWEPGKRNRDQGEALISQPRVRVGQSPLTIEKKFDHQRR